MSCWGFFFSLFPSKATKKQTIKNIWNYADHYKTLFFWVISCANHTKAQVWCWYTLEAFEDKLWSGLLKLFWRWMWPYSKCMKHKHKCISYPHTTALWVEIQLAVKNGCRMRKVEEKKQKAWPEMGEMFSLLGFLNLSFVALLSSVLIFILFVTMLGGAKMCSLIFIFPSGKLRNAI